MNLRFNSMLSRIAAMQIVAVAVACVALPLALYFLLKTTVAGLEQRAMEEQAHEISDYLEHKDARWILRLPARLQDSYSVAYGRYAYSIEDAQGNTLFSSFVSGNPILSDDPHGDKTSYFHLRRHGGDLYGDSVPVVVDGVPLWIQVSEDFSNRDVLVDDVVADFFPQVGWITAPILLLLLIIEIVIVRAGLKPVLIASNQAAKIGPASTDIRLPESGFPGEIQPLVHAINAALERLEQGFKAQRDFTADAAHELRTPLAILRTNIDLIADQEIASALRQDVTMMSRLVDQLLNFAELETLVIGSNEVADLHAVCADVAAYLAPLAVKQNKSLAVPECPTPILIRGNADVLGQAVRNLIENALTHTPAGTTVEVEVTPEPAIYVRDQGP
ncbi:MAG: sensor histidine kinase N-terminal domain-containing protein, partial [Alphaproteobacteria bacterium]|nr:sensor histidine kinase N-terminal domain-containing protein [Alphaproteobacteria bacterium]